MFTLLIVSCAVLGLFIGSFLNVVIHRVPQGRSIVTPRSTCPVCGSPISPRDNIPVVSFLMLRGRCRACGTHISSRYPLVEAGTAGLFAAAAARIGVHLVVVSVLVFLAGLIALAAIDLEHLKLPRAVVYVTSAGVVASLLVDAAATGRWHRLLVAALCAATWFVVFFAINAISPRYLGFGDVRLAPLLGLELGWFGVDYALIGFFAANLIGSVVGITLIATKRMRRDQPVPYGVFLALGAVFALFAGPSILAPLHLH